MDYPDKLISLFSHFSKLFSNPVWENALVLLFGAILCPRQRTVTAILRVMGLSQEKYYQNYHRVLNRAKWSPFQGAKILLGLIIHTGLHVLPGHIIIAIDETVERRQGKKITAKGCYRDAVRSSESCVIKCFGLKWTCTTVLVKLPWSDRPWALPFLTVLAPSKAANEKKGKRHKTAVDWAVQIVKVTSRWLKTLSWNGSVIFLGDGGYASMKLMWACAKSGGTLVCRFRLDAALYNYPEVPPLGKRGPKAKKGKKQRSLKERAYDPETSWKKADVKWYGGKKKEIEYFSGNSLWYTKAFNPFSICWVVIRLPETGRVEIVCSTDDTLDPVSIIELFVLRWNIEVTFEETRRHLGVETQRQWSDQAIMRTTPCLMGLFSLVTLFGLELDREEKVQRQETAWYKKGGVTFSDILSAVRTEILKKKYFRESGSEPDIVNFFENSLALVIQELASAA